MRLPSFKTSQSAPAQEPAKRTTRNPQIAFLAIPSLRSAILRCCRTAGITCNPSWEDFERGRLYRACRPGERPGSPTAAGARGGARPLMKIVRLSGPGTNTAIAPRNLWTAVSRAPPPLAPGDERHHRRRGEECRAEEAPHHGEGEA